MKSLHVLRDWRVDDHEGLLDLWQESWQVTMPGIDFAARRPGFSDYLHGLIAGGARCRVAEAEGLAGFYTLDGAGYLDQIAVARALWGNGTATLLIEDAKGLSPGLIDLKVNQQNVRAIRFYERLGFQRQGADINPVSGLPLWRYRWQVQNSATGP